ncbi:MAG: D-alanyl-D-alanine carboxypeptidase/D-alanyl-D-alanine-endopeptidase [uncultured bacterium]|nr:MAG: D-alanyl-D-alanine carboxypeptidase/D-alanyl-D-alanine-endopeptidase [uncultured bacterium]
MRIFYYLAILWMIFCFSDPAIAKHKKKKVKKRKHITSSYVMSVAPAIYGTSQLTNEINKLVYSNSANAGIGVYVKSMRSGATLYSYNINRSFVPASTMKVMTAEAALIFLGPNYRFSTQLLTDAKSVRNGILQGNLYIVLSGDPTLTYNDLVEMMMALQSQQIRAIAGNVYIDNTAYDQSFYGPGWVYKDRSYCYGAPISASIINRNCPPIRLLVSDSDNQTKKTAAKKSYRRRTCSLRTTDDPNSMTTIDDCMSGNWGINYAVTNVPEYNRSLVKSLLQRLSVNIYGRVTFGSAGDNLSMINQHSSEPLNEMIKEMLKKSDNVIAGALFKKIGQLYARQPGSWENGSIAVAQILAKKTGLTITGMRLLDGSGLSPYNLLTPAQMMRVLDYAYHSSTSDDFISALPISGVDGTLKHRMGNIARKVRAKTGTISGVVSLGGYTITAEKEPLAFVIMVNGSKGYSWRYRSMEDKIATALTRYRNA